MLVVILSLIVLVSCTTVINNKYEVTFIIPNTGTTTVESSEWYFDQTQLPQYARDGYTFLGWYYIEDDVEKPFDFNAQKITSDITLFARYEKNETVIIDKKVIVKLYEDASNYTTYEWVNENNVFTVPVKDGYTFDGWFLDILYTQPFNISFSNYSSTTLDLYAKMVSIDAYYNVYFLSTDGDTILYTTVLGNNTVSIPDVSYTNIDNYLFIGWYDSPSHTSLYNFNSPITADTYIYGRWEESEETYYSVSFYSLDGTVLFQQNIQSGSIIEKPSSSQVVIEGYNFINWYTTNTFTTLFNFNTPIANNTNIYGKWEQNSSSNGDNYPYTGNYYNSININNPTEVKNLISATQPSSYDQAKTTLRYSDVDPNNPNNVLTVYSRTSVTGPWSSGGTIWNREHVFPNSKCGYQLGSGTPSEHDTHNLKPAKADENGSRGNASYGPGSGTFGMVGGYFWAGDKDKGDVARIIMYMSLRWGLKPDGNTGAFYSIALMLQWSNEDPVDAFEMHRNDVIHQYQGNRNPFIDHPELAQTIWGSSSKNNTQTIDLNQTLEGYISCISICTFVKGNVNV
jgi:uncharacterized repeat protein (TIGR02543 family)